MEEYQKQEIKDFLSRYRVCEYCNGDGWTSEHNHHSHEDGCDGCPIQVGCEWCEGLGCVVIDKPFKKSQQVEVSDIPF